MKLTFKLLSVFFLYFEYNFTWEYFEILLKKYFIIILCKPLCYTHKVLLKTEDFYKFL